MDQEKLKEIYMELFLVPEMLYVDAEENKIYFIDEKNDFKVFNSPIPVKGLDVDDLETLIGRIKVVIVDEVQEDTIQADV